MNNDTEVSIKFKNQVTGEKKLKDYAETLKHINSILLGLNSKSTKDLDASAKNTKDISGDISNISRKTNIAFNYNLISKFASGIKRLASSFGSLTKESFDFLENFNLFQVAFNGNYTSAERFVNKMSEMYGLDESWLIQTTGKFKQLANAMGVTEETGEKVSKLLTQMSLDISSLYNVDFDRASSVLQSSLAGQTKPIRGLAGGDITQATLQTTLDQLGIDSAVNKLSFAEKRLLIIISLTRQLNGSIGDLARTIESPSNQMRILNDQWERLTRAVGNVFLPILAKILPYLNAILMVLTEIISSIAALLGYNADDFDYFDSASTGAWDLDEGLKSAGASAKKLKQGLRGFDKLNVITTPSAGGSGSGIGTGINPKLLDAFNKTFDEYQSKLTNVQMKATKIRDSIMEWLGYTKQVDEETGDVSFKFDHITGGTVLGALAVGGTIFNGIKSIFGILEKIGLVKLPSFTKISELGKIFSSGNISKFGKTAGIIGMIAFSWGTVFKEFKENEDFRNKVERLKTSFERFGTALKKVYTKVKPVFDFLFKVLKELGKVVKNILENVVIRNFTMMIDKISGILDILSLLIDGDFKGAFKRLGQLAKDLWEDWSGAFKNIINGIKELPGKLAYWAGEAIGKLWKLFTETDWIQLGKDIVGDIIEGLGEFGSKIWDKVKSFVDEVKKAFEDGTILTKLKNIGISIIKTILTAMTWPASLGASVIGKFVDGIKKALGIETKNLSKSGSSGTGHTGSGKKGASGGVFTPNGLKYDVRRYEGGGLPPVGQMFIAREKGPELVGQIGSHTAVLNNNQIVDSVASGVYDAVYKANQNSRSSQSINPTFIIQVGNKELAKQVVTDLQDMAKTNGKPIIIGG